MRKSPLEIKEEFCAKVKWFGHYFGQDRIKDLIMEVHANEENFDNCMEQFGQSQFKGCRESIFIKNPNDGVGTLAHICNEHDWMVMCVPDMEDWTVGEKTIWAKLNN